MTASAYLARAQEIVARVVETQSARIEQAGAAVATAMAAGHRLWTFGTGHSHMLAEELYNRAGGFDDVHAVLEPALMVHESAAKSAALERLPGLAESLISALEPGIEAGDVLIIASNSGRNAVPVEFADRARSLGATVIAVTSLAHSRSVDSRAPSGKRLFEVADIVIDNCGVPGDAVLTIEGLPEATGATSTVTGALVVQAIAAEAVARLVAEGHEPSVLRSYNSDPAATGR